MVRGNHQLRAATHLVLQQLLDLADGRDVESIERLVEQQQSPACDRGAGEQRQAQLPVRQIPRPPRA
jgi:hypothetical protein